MTKPRLKLIFNEDVTLFEEETNKFIQNENVVLLNEPNVEPAHKGFYMKLLYITKEEYIENMKNRKAEQNARTVPGSEDDKKKTIVTHES